ncbi:Thioredoxin [Durusdinium trenchii]|uniref:Thioredoxin n=1 Tax=Durusdinium trenchii TaxID=1381693 RepID=A0ABP0ISI3_9DINO
MWISVSRKTVSLQLRRPDEVNHLTSAAQLDELQRRSKQESWALVLDFTAPWCKPCQALKPRFQARFGNTGDTPSGVEEEERRPRVECEGMR